MDGLLALKKERGMTSHDCVFRLRKILKTKKIGHGGTLDPDVSGVLPIGIGRGTKVLEYMADSGKVYVGSITLGFSTTTEDKSGEIVRKTPLKTPFSEKEIAQVLAGFVGKITQIPPMYSAVKVGGKKLYEYARSGIEVERPKRCVEVYSFERVGEMCFDEKNGTQTFSFRVACGKGTYVRTLAVDVGEKLGVASHMSDLTRVKAAGLEIEESYTLEEVEQFMARGEIASLLSPIEVAVKEFPRFSLNAQQFEKVRNGGVFTENELDNVRFEHLLVMYFHEKAIALYEHHPTKAGKIKPRKVLGA